MSWPPFCTSLQKGELPYHHHFHPQKKLNQSLPFWRRLHQNYLGIHHHKPPKSKKKKKNNCFKHLQMKETAHPTIPPSKKSIPTASLQGHLSLQLGTGLQGWLLRTSSLKEEPSWKPRNEPVGIPRHHSQHRPSSGLSFCIISISFFQKKHGT